MHIITTACHYCYCTAAAMLLIRLPPISPPHPLDLAISRSLDLPANWRDCDRPRSWRGSGRAHSRVQTPGHSLDERSLTGRACRLVAPAR